MCCSKRRPVQEACSRRVAHSAPRLPLPLPQPAATKENPEALYWTRGQYIYVLAPARTVVAYRKVGGCRGPTALLLLAAPRM